MLLGDLAGFQTFRREATELREELRDYQREQFDGWSRHVLAAIDHPTEPLRWANSSQGMDYQSAREWDSLQTKLSTGWQERKEQLRRTCTFG